MLFLKRARPRSKNGGEEEADRTRKVAKKESKQNKGRGIIKKNKEGAH